jgi:hypothetical protein
LGYLILRVSLGLNMMIHCAGRIHTTGLQAWVAATEKGFVDSILPMRVTHWWLTILSPLEGVIGVLLVLGLGTLPTITAEGIVITVLLFGTAAASTF